MSGERARRLPAPVSSNPSGRWAGSAVYMILEPVHLRRTFERRARLYHVIPALITTLALLAQIQVHAPYEEHGVRFFRGISFTLLSLVWIYVVGIHQTQSLEPLWDNSSHFIARFCPVLYMPTPLAVLFSLLAATALGYQYYKLFIQDRHTEHGTDLEMAHLAQEESMPRPDGLHVIPEETQELEEMFRLAKQSRSH